MTDTTGNINSKGLDGTGISEEIVGDLFNKVGTHMMAIVDLQVVDKAGPNLKGKRKVVFVIDGIEPALDENLAEHLRELQRTVYLNRKHSDGQLTIDHELGAGAERTVDDVVKAGTAQRPHPFLPVDAADDNGICDVCGLLETAPRHSVQDQLDDETGDQGDPQLPDPDDHDDSEPAAAGDTLAGQDGDQTPDEPWEYAAGEGPREPSTIGSPFDTTTAGATT